MILVDMFSSPLMQRALIVAFLVGMSAPVMGTYLVQRRLTLLGDGIGHISLTGVALGWLASSAAGAASQDAWAIPGAIVAAILGALAIEWMRSRGHASGDVALAILFYGGIAGGVLLIGIAGGTTANLNAYLFGSISTVTTTDVYLTILLAALVFGVGLGLRPALFALCQDEENARASGLPVGLMSVIISVTAALTVAVSMRVVGALMVSALMIIPVAVAQLVTRSFNATMYLAMGIGTVSAFAGLTTTFVKPWSPGATIVIIAVVLYALTAIISPLIHRAHRTPKDPHLDVEPDIVGIDAERCVEEGAL